MAPVGGRERKGRRLEGWRKGGDKWAPTGGNQRTENRVDETLRTSEREEGGFGMAT